MTITLPAPAPHAKSTWTRAGDREYRNGLGERVRFLLIINEWVTIDRHGHEGDSYRTERLAKQAVERGLGSGSFLL